MHCKIIPIVFTKTIVESRLVMPYIIHIKQLKQKETKCNISSAWWAQKCSTDPHFKAFKAKDHSLFMKENLF